MNTIDVVIPLHNGARYIGETLQSVFGQSRRPERVIIVDDNSTDDSRKIVSKLGWVTLIPNTGRPGAAGARNTGLLHSRSPLVAFLDQDDLWHPLHLETLAALLERYPEADLAAASIKTFADGTRPRYDVLDRSVFRFDPWTIYPTHDQASTPSATLIRREALVERGGWPARWEGMSDYAAWMRLSIAKPVARTRTRSIAYRIRGDSALARLRRDPSRYLDLSLAVDDELMTLFLGSSAPEQEKLLVKKRNLAGHYLAAAVRALAVRDARELSSAFRRLEALLDGETAAYRRSLFLYLFFMYRGYAGKADNFNNEYHFLLEALPAGAHLTRSVLFRIIVEGRPGLAFYCDHFRRRPWQVSRINPFLSALQFRMEKSGVLSSRAQRAQRA